MKSALSVAWHHRGRCARLSCRTMIPYSSLTLSSPAWTGKADGMDEATVTLARRFARRLRAWRRRCRSQVPRRRRRAQDPTHPCRVHLPRPAPCRPRTAPGLWPQAACARRSPPPLLPPPRSGSSCTSSRSSSF